MTDLRRQYRLKILLHARSRKFKLRKKEPFKYVLDSPSCVFNIYWNKKNYSFTVGTALNHPSKGNTQLWRRKQSCEDVISLLDNPRLHTGKGYYKK